MTEKSYSHLNVFMAKIEFATRAFSDFLDPDNSVMRYNLDQRLNLEGELYVKRPFERMPKWSKFVDALTGVKVTEISNKSSSAVLFLRVDQRVFAFTFGYGRYLVNTAFFVQDFGLKTALNTLDHEGLRSVDLHTLEDQPIQKKSQATRESNASVFGIDISRDVLRAVTGAPKSGINFKNISGGDSMFSFGVELLLEELADLAKQITQYYENEDYKAGFAWVDNVRRLKDQSLIEKLESKLVSEILSGNKNVVITLPEIEKWDTIIGFSFTRSKNEISPTIDSDNYFSHLDEEKFSIDAMKRDRLYVHDIHGNEFNHSMYKCIYFEFQDQEKTHIIFGGIWYEIDNIFMARINSVLNLIDISELKFPDIEVWKDGEDNKIEAEGDYNIRAAITHGYYLLDKKLIKTNKTTSSIELCDLLTSNRQFIHVKHRKGGSAGLSHLFAQGSVAAELVLGNKEFRKAARAVLARIDTEARNLIPLDNLKSLDYEVVFLILGEKNATVKQNLPFFSKVNLSHAYENLSQRGFSVKIAAATKVEK